VSNQGYVNLWFPFSEQSKMDVRRKLYGILIFFSAFAVGYSSQIFFGVRESVRSETSTYLYRDKSVTSTTASDCLSPLAGAFLDLEMLKMEKEDFLQKQKGAKGSRQLRELNNKIRRLQRYVDTLLNEPDPNKSAPLNDLIYRKRCVK